MEGQAWLQNYPAGRVHSTHCNKRRRQSRMEGIRMARFSAELPGGVGRGGALRG